MPRRTPFSNDDPLPVDPRLVRARLDSGYLWGYEGGLGWADLTDELRRILFDQGSEDIHELTLAEDLGL